MDDVNHEKKESISGQMSLFDMFAPEEKPAEISIPKVGEYNKGELLSYEKEVLGIYVSGHPLDEYDGLMTKNITNMTLDFAIDEETGMVRVKDDDKVIVGGIIAAKNVKITKKGQNMAFITLEDHVGTVEVVVFPKVYMDYRQHIVEDNKIFVVGRVNVDEEAGGKIICDRIIPFDSIPKECWIKFDDKASYMAAEEKLFSILESSDGNDVVVIYCEAEKAKKILPLSMSIKADFTMVSRLSQAFGEKNVKVVEKSIEK